MTGDAPPAQLAEPEPIPDPSQPGSGWRITQIAPALPGWNALTSGPETNPETITRPVAVWALLEERSTGRQTIRAYIVDQVGGAASLSDGQAEAVTTGREWYGLDFADPTKPDEG
jgi:hypothetical protein